MELIVVLVILATLAALLVPSLTGYIDKARSSPRPMRMVSWFLMKTEWAIANLIRTPPTPWPRRLWRWQR